MGQTQFLQILKGSECFAKQREKARTGSNKTGIWGSDHKYKWFCKVFATSCIEEVFEETKKNTKKSLSSETYVWGNFVSNVNRVLLINELYISFGDCCCSVVVICMSLQSHRLQHARLPCPSLTLEFAQIHVQWVSDAIQPSHPLLLTFPPALNLSQHQDLFRWVGSLYQVAEVLELQLQHWSFYWIAF